MPSSDESGWCALSWSLHLGLKVLSVVVGEVEDRDLMVTSGKVNISFVSSNSMDSPVVNNLVVVNEKLGSISGGGGESVLSGVLDSNS